MGIVHTPVLLKQVLENVITADSGSFLDCTLGEGGHSEAILTRFKNITICGLDRDKEILKVAGQRLAPFGSRFVSYNMNFTDAADLKDKGYCFDYALIDLGISVFHYKLSGRGFSFSQSERLDMRLDDNSISVFDIINGFSESELKDIFYKYGEEKFTPGIVKKIIQRRSVKKIEFSDELANIVLESVPYKNRFNHTHPATKIFQALRIAANNEFENIEKGIPAVLSVLKPGGRLGVITFHSLEDRIVKKMFAEMDKECICPPKIPKCICGKVKEVRIIGKSLIPSDEEIESNPPSRSARLRIVEKV